MLSSLSLKFQAYYFDMFGMVLLYTGIKEISIRKRANDCKRSHYHDQERRYVTDKFGIKRSFSCSKSVFVKTFAAYLPPILLEQL